ncbi:MAG: sigma-70 family RNA polymerase sigma factor [Acidobacteriota bacterium]
MTIESDPPEGGGAVPEGPRATDRVDERTQGEVTVLLDNWNSGDAGALDDLLPLVQGELRSLAARYLRKERAGHTLQPTALVHEAFVRLLGGAQVAAQSRTHFFAIAAQAMRRVLVDHARRQGAAKRIGAHDKISLEGVVEPAVEPGVDVLLLHDALDALATINPRQAKLVELRYFGGFSNAEAAEVLGTSLRTVKRDWQVARLWLYRRLQSDDTDPAEDDEITSERLP